MEKSAVRLRLGRPARHRPRPGIGPRCPRATVLVLDIGKTNAKAVLVDGATLAEIDVLTAPNRPLPGPPYPHADTEALWRFVLDAAGTMQARHGVGAVVVTTHGATAALVDAAGELALPVLDYEHPGPDELAAEYDAAAPALRRDRLAAASGRPQRRAAALLAVPPLPRGRRAHRGHPDVPAVLGAAPLGRAGLRAHLARLPHRPLEPARGRLLLARRSDGLAPAHAADPPRRRHPRAA